MNAGQIALVVIGTVALAESSWGLASPASLRKAVEAASREVPNRNPWLAMVFAGCAGLLWVLMSAERTAVDYALLVVSWLLAGGALVNLAPGGFKRTVSFLILDRSVRAIRLFYAGEFVVACVLIAIGLGDG